MRNIRDFIETIIRQNLDRRSWQSVWQLLILDIYLYLAAGFAIWVLSALTGDTLWPVALWMNVIHLLLLPSFVVLPFMLIRRRWAGAGLAAANVIAFLWLFGSLFFPAEPNLVSAASPGGDSLSLTVLTFNVAHGRADPDVLVDVLEASAADVIGLQELSTGQADAIHRDLYGVYPYQALYPDGEEGIGLISRYPILEDGLIFLDSQRPYLQAKLEIEGQPVTVFVAHPNSPEIDMFGRGYRPRSRADLEGLVSLIDSTQATLLMGDLNLTDQSSEYDLLLETGLVDAFRQVGQGFGATFPSEQSLVRIDYVWYSPAHFNAADVQVGEQAGSNHLPVIVQLTTR
jgi:endonuclease/exonuclease/phosphatase (EEP) superfamily protein YafD